MVDQRSRWLKILRRGAGVLLIVGAIVAVLSGMVHATNELHLAASQPTKAAVPTLGNVAPTIPPQRELAVRGARIVDGDGRPVMLVGATDFSLEFSCHGGGHFQMADFQAMRSWGMNTVRITLSSAFWRNLDGGCPDYVATVTGAVANALSSGLFVILALQWNAPFSLSQDAQHGGAQCPLPDATYDVRFWQDIATIYQSDPRVIFDLFSEPHNIDWYQWEHGGTVTSSCFLYATPHTYQAIGMPQLASKVRAIAPNNLIILSGAGWGYDLSGIQANSAQPMTNVLYGVHPFNHGSGSQQPGDWPRAFGKVAAQLPVIATEFGSYDCQTNYISREISYFEQLSISFIAWAWTTGSCTTPSLLADWSGTPTTPYGVYIQQRMRALAKGAQNS